MADLAVIATVRVIDAQAMDQFSAPAGEAFGPGEAVRWDGTTGKLTPGNATVAAEAEIIGLNIAHHVNQANITANALRKGLVALYDASGNNILAGLDYGALVYLSNTDGRLADAAGTVSKVVGRVAALWDQTTPTKVLAFDLTP